MSRSKITTVKALHHHLAADGCHFRRTGTGHIRVTKDGAYVTTLASSLSDNHRGLRNAIAEARRAGIPVNH